jgi:hypothetical protein
MKPEGCSAQHSGCSSAKCLAATRVLRTQSHTRTHLQQHTGVDGTSNIRSRLVSAVQCGSPVLRIETAVTAATLQNKHRTQIGRGSSRVKCLPIFTDHQQQRQVQAGVQAHHTRRGEASTQQLPATWVRVLQQEATASACSRFRTMGQNTRLYAKCQMSSVSMHARRSAACSVTATAHSRRGCMAQVHGSFWQL